MKVYVVTAFKPLQVETYIAVKATKKQAEKVIRAHYPNAKLCEENVCDFRQDYECHDKMGSVSFMSILEEII